MRTGSSLRAPLTAAAFALLLLTATQAPAAPPQGPAALITYVGTQGIQALGGNIPSADREARLSQLFYEDFDVNGIGLFALGSYRAMATPQRRCPGSCDSK